jgi:proteasome component ECM29
LTAFQDSKLRSGAYVAIGKLSRKEAKIFAEDPSYIDRLMTLLEKEVTDVQQSVAECLAYMAQAYQYRAPGSGPVTEKQRKKAEVARQVVVGLMSRKEPRVRAMAVQYIASVFPPDSVERGYQLIVAASDP